jgi:hypothetical protein
MYYVELTCRLLLAAVFVTAAAGKLSRSAFTEFVASTGRLLPTRFVRWRRPAGVAVLVAEIATAAMLLIGPAAEVGLASAAGLSVAFTAGVAGALRRGERASCSCFGTSTSPIGPAHVVRNATLAAAALVGLASAQAVPAPAWHPGGAAIAVGVGLVAATLVVRLEDITALFTRLPQGD